MKYWKQLTAVLMFVPLVACSGGNQSKVSAEPEPEATDSVNQVIETIMTRRSVRQVQATGCRA